LVFITEYWLRFRTARVLLQDRSCAVLFFADQAEEREMTFLIGWRRGERQKWHAIKGVRSTWATAVNHLEAKFGTSR
jgi:hypothetical protein